MSIGFIKDNTGKPNGYYVDEHIFIAKTAREFGFKHLRLQQPYRVAEGRILLVTSGTARVAINLKEFTLEKQSVLVLVQDGIFELLEISDDFDAQAFTFMNLPIFTSLDRQFVTTLSDDEWSLANEYFNLLWHEVNRQPLLVEAIVHLQTAILLELKRISANHDNTQNKSDICPEAHLHHFLELVNQYGLKERKIEFYADKMCVTPNHLGAIIKQASGLTIMQWLNRHAVQKAKVLLHYSDNPVWQIAEQMNFVNPSFFSQFFKRETGLTPNEYRQLK